MPKGPRGEKRPGDVIGASIMVAKLATGEITEETAIKSAAAELGSRGGKARAGFECLPILSIASCVSHRQLHCGFLGSQESGHVI